jgi:hypothetical protein
MIRTIILLIATAMLIGACSSSSAAVLAPTNPPTAAVATPRILAFTVSPNPVERGQDLVVSWQVDGAAQAALWRLWYNSKLNDWYQQPDPLSSGSNSGEYRLTVPRDADRTLRFELEAKNAAGDSITATSDEIQLVCHALFFKAASPPWCPNAPETTSAVFQAFEGGYMIWRSDTGQVMVLRRAAPDLPPDWFTFFPTDEATEREIPSGKSAPGEHFQRAWASLPEVWGEAVTTEQAYSMTIHLSLSRGDVMNQNDDLYLTFPTGEIAHLLVYLSAPNHDSGPAWSFLGSDQSSTATETPSVSAPGLATHTTALISEPASITFPAGSSGRVVVKMAECDQQSAAFETPTLPFGITAEFLVGPTPCEQVLVLHTNVSLLPGEYTIAVTRRSSANRTASGQVTVQTTACIELQSGEFTSDIRSNLITLVTAGKPAIEHGLLVPLQFCGERQLTIELLSATSEVGTSMTTPPRFYLYRSWVWPPPDAILANAAMPGTTNVAMPRIDSSGWQLTTRVPACMYLLVFERDAYGS